MADDKNVPSCAGMSDEEFKALQKRRMNAYDDAQAWKRENPYGYAQQHPAAAPAAPPEPTIESLKRLFGATSIGKEANALAVSNSAEYKRLRVFAVAHKILE